MRVARHIRRTIIGAAAAMSLLIVVFAVQNALAQEPEGPLLPEPGSEDAPGDIGYGREWPAVFGEQEDCEIDPGDPRCPPPAPYSIARPVVSYTSTSVNLTSSFTRVTWGTNTQHYYKFELHRSMTTTGTFTLHRSTWDGKSPVTFNGVTRGYYYKLRAKRCRVWRSETDCGEFGRFSPSVYVPSIATGPMLTRNVLKLTASYTAVGTTWDDIDVYVKGIGTSGTGTEVDTGINANGQTWTATRGNQFRFHVRRCKTSGRTECDQWSSWSPWVAVPNLPELASGLTLSRRVLQVTASFNARGAGHNRIELAEREVDDDGDGDVDKVNPSGTSHTFTGTRGEEYRFRVSRCLDSQRKECGDWTSWTRWFEVPEFPPDAYDLDWTRARTTLTYSFKITGDPEETKAEIEGWVPLATEFSTTGTADLTTQSGSVSGTRGLRYRFRVARCTDAARTDCAGADDRSDWSDWITVPHLPSKPPTPRLSRVKNNLAFSFTVSDTSNSNLTQKYHLQRTGGNTGTFQDYRNGTANDRKLQGVDRNYSYQLSVSYCTDAGLTDCGAQSNWSASLLVPDLPTDPGTPELEVDDDDLTVTYTAAGEANDQLRFQQSDSEDDGFSTYTEGTLNGKVLSNVERNKYYKVQVRRCTDAAFTDCTGWSSESNVVKVAPAPVQAKPTIASRADGKSAVASFTLLDGFDYTLQLQSLRSNTRGATWTPVGSSASLADSATKRTYTGLAGGTSLDYRVRLSACPESTSNNCVNHDSTSITLSKAPAPSVSSLSLANQDDLTVVYTVTAWTNGTGDHYDFEIERGETATGSFSDYDDATTPSATPHVFNNVHTGYYYKARGRRCSDSAATICGDWSRYTAALNVPALAVPVPANITLTNPSLATVRAAFTPGTLNRRSVQYHVFEVGKSDTETGTFVYGGANETDATSSVSFSELEIGKWYKVRGKGCLDAAWKRCGLWAQSSGAVQVEGIGVTIGSGANGKSVIVSLSLFSGFTYSLQLFGSANEKDWSNEGRSAVTPDSNATGHTYKGLVLEHYRVELIACKAGRCVTHQSNKIAISKAPAPEISGITLSDENHLTIGYSLPAWNYGSGYVLDFAIKRADSATATFATYGGASSPDGMPHKFDDVHTGYYYKAQGRRCSDSALAICGDWSNLSSAVNVPALSVPAPTAIGVLMVNHTQIQATFSLSSWAGQSVHNYAFEVGKSDSESGIYVYGRTKLVSASPVTFGTLETGKWYKIRGKRCFDGNRKRCGSWVESANAVETVEPNPKLKFDNAVTKVTIDAGLHKSIIASASGLDRTKLYKIEFQTSRNAVLKFAKCDAEKELEDLLDSVDQSLTPRSGTGGPVSKKLYACVSGIDPSTDEKIDPAPSDTLTVNLVEGVGAPVTWGNTVDTIELTATLEVVPSPTDLRADGDNRDNDDGVEFDIAWKRVSGATGYQLHYGEQCRDHTDACLSATSTWNTPISVRGAHGSPYSVTVETPDLNHDTMYRVELRTERNGILSAWSDSVFVYPDDAPTRDIIGKMSFWGFQSDRDYTYRLCESTIPRFYAKQGNKPVERDEWVREIESGFEEWSKEVDWSTGIHGEERKYVSTTRDIISRGPRGPGTCDGLSVASYEYPLHPPPGPPTVKRPPEDPWPRGIPNHPYAEVRFVNYLVIKNRCSLWGLPFIAPACSPNADNPVSLLTIYHRPILPNRSIPGDVDILFDVDEEWVPSSGIPATGCTFLRRTATHEVGHALGASGSHSSDPTAIMYEEPSSDVCTPNAYDVVGMLTNYQSLVPK